MDLHHLRVIGPVAPEHPGEFAVELAFDGQGLAGVVDGDDEVDAILGGGDVLGREVSKAQEIRAARIERALDILDDDVVEIATHHVGVAAPVALDVMTRARDIKDLVVAAALDHLFARIVDHHAIFVDGHALCGCKQAVCGIRIFPRGHDRLEQLFAVDLVVGFCAVVGIDPQQHFVPVGQPVVGLVRIGGHVGEDLLEHRDQFASGGRHPDVGVRAVFDPGKEIRQPGLRRRADRHGARQMDVGLHQNAKEFDRRFDDRHVFRFGLRRRIDQAAGLVDQQAAIGIDAGRQDLGLEDLTVTSESKAELVNREDLGAVTAVEGAVRLVQRIEVDLIAAQAETAGATFLELKLQRPVEVARPHVETAVVVLDPDGVIDHLTVDQVDPDAIRRHDLEGIEPEGLRAPCLRFGRGDLAAHIGEGRAVDHDAIAVKNRRARLQGPIAAFGVLHPNAPVENGGAVLDHIDEIGPFGAQLRRLGPVGGGEHLLDPPALGREIREARVGYHRPAGVGQHVARGQLEPAADLVLHPLGAVENPGHAIDLSRQDRRQLKALFERPRPSAENGAYRITQRIEVGNVHRAGGSFDRLLHPQIAGGVHREIRQQPASSDVDGAAIRAKRDEIRHPVVAVEFRPRQVGIKDHLVGVANRAVIAGKRPALAQQVLLRGQLIQHRPAKIEGGDPQHRQREEFRMGRGAALIQIAPDLKVIPDRVVFVDHPVAVVVVPGKLLIPRLGLRAEHLFDILDATVVEFIDDEEAVVAGQPARLLREVVAVEVEMHPGLVQRRGLDPIAVKVQYQWIFNRLPVEAFGQRPEFVDVISDLPPDREEGRDLQLIAANDAEIHVEGGFVGPPQPGILEFAELEILDDHRIGQNALGIGELFVRAGDIVDH